MSDIDPQNVTREELANPAVPAEVLARCAAERPDLWDVILNHPNTYPGLNDWIHARSMPQHQAMPQHQPSVSEHGQPVSTVASGEAGYPAGTRQTTGGARDFFNQRVAPVAVTAAQTVREATYESYTTGKQASAERGVSGLYKIFRFSPLVQAAAALLCMIGLFMPALDVPGEIPLPVADELELSGLSTLTMVVMAVALVLSLAAFIRGRWKLQVLSGVMGIVASHLGVVAGFTPGLFLSRLETWSHGMLVISVGAGPVVVSLFSLVLAAGGLGTVGLGFMLAKQASGQVRNVHLRSTHEVPSSTQGQVGYPAASSPQPSTEPEAGAATSYVEPHSDGATPRNAKSEADSGKGSTTA